MRRTAVASPGRVDGDASGHELRVGIVGPGLFARSTLLPLLAGRNVRLVAVAGATSPRAFGVARRAGAAWVATDSAEVIDAPDVDVVVIATRHDSHAQLAADALERGKGVFVEKPLAIDREGLERIETLLPSGRLVVDFNRSFSPAALAVAGHFSARSDPLHVHCRVNAGLLPADHWLRDPDVGGGRLVGEGCHFVDLCSSIVGAPVATVAVQALGAGARTLPGDSWVLMLTYADGSVAVIGYVAAGSERLSKERIEVHGGGRSAVIDDFRRHWRYGGARERLVRPPAALSGQDKGHGAALDAALAFFRSGGDPPVPYARMSETTRVTLAAREAMSAGRTEPFSLAAP
jgi:predicted dehydrogenase